MAEARRAIRLADRRNLAPLKQATTSLKVRLQDVEGTTLQELGVAGHPVLVLGTGNGHVDSTRHRRQSLGVVHRERFLKPRRPQFLQATGRP